MTVRARGHRCVKCAGFGDRDTPNRKRADGQYRCDRCAESMDMTAPGALFGWPRQKLETA